MNCPEGFTLRKGYTRKFSKNIKSDGFTVRRKGKLFTVKPKANAVNVAASCVKKRSIRTTRKKGELLKYGYQYRLSDAVRHKALKKAANVYTPLALYKKLNEVAKLSSNSAKNASVILAKDRNWVQDNLM